jgi:hypothetical protein
VDRGLNLDKCRDFLRSSRTQSCSKSLIQPVLESLAQRQIILEREFVYSPPSGAKLRSRGGVPPSPVCIYVVVLNCGQEGFHLYFRTL